MQIIVLTFLILLQGAAVDWNYSVILDLKALFFVVVPTVILSIVKHALITKQLKWQNWSKKALSKRVFKTIGDLATWMGLLGSLIGGVMTFVNAKDGIVANASAQGLVLSLLPILYGINIKVLCTLSVDEEENE